MLFVRDVLVVIQSLYMRFTSLTLIYTHTIFTYHKIFIDLSEEGGQTWVISLWLRATAACNCAVLPWAILGRFE